MLKAPTGSAATPCPRRTEIQRQLVLRRSTWRSEGRSWRRDVGLAATWALRSEGRTMWRGEAPAAARGAWRAGGWSALEAW